MSLRNDGIQKRADAGVAPKLKPSVSVLVPVYNEPVEKIDRCLSSIHAQSCANLHIFILLTGPQNPKAAEFLTQYSKNNSSVSFTHNPTGLRASEARNYLLKTVPQSQRAILAFLDADDEWMPNHLSQFLEQCSLEDDQYSIYTAAYHLRQSEQIVTPKGHAPSLMSLTQQPLLISSTIIRNDDGRLGFSAGVAEDFVFFAHAIRSGITFYFGAHPSVIYDQENWQKKTLRFKIRRSLKTFYLIHNNPIKALWHFVCFSGFYVFRRLPFLSQRN